MKVRPKIRPASERDYFGKRVRRSLSAVKIDPPCPHYPHCIGCPLIDVPYPAQLLRKRDIVTRALATCPSLAHLEVPSVVASPHRLGYRARVKLVVRSVISEGRPGTYNPESNQGAEIRNYAL